MDFVTSDGAHLSYERHGPAKGAPTVVLLHGWSLDRRVWSWQVDALGDVAVVAYDARGHGRSGPVTRTTATLGRLADDLAEVLGAVTPTDRVVLVGHSLGGMTIIEYAHRHPAHFAEHVCGVVLVSTTAEGALHTTYGFSPALAPAVRAGELAGCWLLAHVGHLRPHWMPRQLLRRSVRWLAFGAPAQIEDLNLVTSIVARTSLRTIGAFGAAVDTHRRLAELAALPQIPVTVLVGARDRLTPLACATNIAAAVPQAHLVVCPEGGHMLPLECRDEVNEALRLTIDRALTEMEHRGTRRSTDRNTDRATACDTAETVARNVSRSMSGSDRHGHARRTSTSGQ
ncbi:alpha/beta hydrolase [Dactylosporangium fulvum]